MTVHSVDTFNEACIRYGYKPGRNLALTRLFFPRTKQYWPGGDKSGHHKVYPKFKLAGLNGILRRAFLLTSPNSHPPTTKLNNATVPMRLRGAQTARARTTTEYEQTSSTLPKIVEAASQVTKSLESVEGVRQLLRYTNDDAEVEATTIYTVGKEGFDGFLCHHILEVQVDLYADSARIVFEQNQTTQAAAYLHHVG
ncbi:hypothetical protein B0H13DRAFT_1902040 [Mycena leptocephala]|nr:hypothetical protein B0H13DRAFT_1902040 [Mycena leptocephala]